MSFERYLNKTINEEVTTGIGDKHLDGKDEIGSFWVVTKPIVYGVDKQTKSDSTIDDILFESTIFGVANQIRGGLSEKGEIYGFYKSEETAKAVAEKLIKDGVTYTV